jgi:hypothetical protein
MAATTQSAWSVDFDPQFEKEIDDAYRLLDKCARSLSGLEHGERYLHEIRRVKEFENFARHRCSGGPDKKFKAAKRRDTGATFHYRELKSWTGYCVVDDKAKHIQWNFAIHDGEYC